MLTTAKIILTTIIFVNFAWADNKTISGVLTYTKNQKANLHLNPMSRSVITIELQNLSEIDKLMKNKNFVGPVTADIQIILQESDNKNASAKLLSFKKFDGEKLPQYDQKLNVVKFSSR